MEGLVKLLGEENEKRLKDGITDLLLQQVEIDLHDKYEYDFILAFDDIYEEVKEEIKETVKQKMMKEYMKKLDGKFSEFSI
jgi:hypothetical protein